MSDVSEARAHLAAQEAIPDNDPDCVARARERLVQAEKAEVARLKLENYTRMENDLFTLRADYRTLGAQNDALKCREAAANELIASLRAELARRDEVEKRLNDESNGLKEQIINQVTVIKSLRSRIGELEGKYGVQEQLDHIFGQLPSNEEA